MKKTKVYRAEEILRRIRDNMRDLVAMEKEITRYLNEVEQRRVDNRSTIEVFRKEGRKYNA